MRKGQAQTALILIGIIILVVVVILFATNRISLQPPEPEAITQAKQTLTAEIEQVIKSDADGVVKKVAEQGGYWSLQDQPLSLSHKGSSVAYWLFGNQTLKRTKADFSQEISKGLKDSLADLDPSEFTSRQVTKGPVQSVETDIRKDSVVVKVNMPVALEGYSLASPFEVTVPVKLGEAIDFANEVVDRSLAKDTIKIENPGEEGTVTTYAVRYPDGVFRDAGGNSYTPSQGTVEENRFFERFTIASLVAYQRFGFDGQPRIPSIGVLEGCGKFLHKDWFDVKPELEDLLRGMLKNTFVAGAGKVPENIADKSSYPSHVLPVVTDLDVKFDLGAELDELSFQMYPNPVDVRTSAPQYIPICFSNPYRVDYRLFYPVVGEVKDGDLDFKFAFMVYVEGYEPGDLGNVGVDLNLDYYKEQLEVCQNALCSADLNVRDIEGPVEGATLIFQGCGLGRTDTQGNLKAKVPCGIGLFDVRDVEHKLYSSLKSSDDLNGGVIFISRTPTSTFHLYNLEVEKISGEAGKPEGTYKITKVEENTKEASLVVDFGGQGFSQETEGSLVVSSTIPAGEVTMSVAVKEAGKDLGGLITYPFITEFDQDYWVYTGLLKSGIDTTKTGEEAALEQFDQLAILSNIVALCGDQIGESLPIASSKVDESKILGCQVTL